jgi:hypothetical protein
MAEGLGLQQTIIGRAACNRASRVTGIALEGGAVSSLRLPIAAMERKNYLL